jgi:hypothetical protein
MTTQPHIIEIDPFDGMDVTPSACEAAALRRLSEGDRFVVDTHGVGLAWERGGPKPPPYLSLALVNKHWAARPCQNGPLFGRPEDGTITERGVWALRRYNGFNRSEQR